MDGNWAISGRYHSYWPHHLHSPGHGRRAPDGVFDEVQQPNFDLDQYVLYNFTTNAYTEVAPMNSARMADAATILPNGQVLVSGGSRNVAGVGTVYLASAELFTP